MNELTFIWRSKCLYPCNMRP